MYFSFIVYRLLFADINYLREIAHDIETNTVELNPNNNDNTVDADSDILSRFFAAMNINNNNMNNSNTGPDEAN